MILTMNNFTFNQEHYLQVHGTAMGTKMAPSFANLFLGIFEINALSNAPFHVHTWWRFLDDIFMIWTEGLDHLKIFIDYLNNIHPTIKFTSSHSLTNVPFPRTDALQTNRHDSINRIPFVVTYNPALPHFSNILRKHFNILLSSDRCRDVFKHPPIVAYRRTSNLRDILVKAQLPAITAPNY